MNPEAPAGLDSNLHKILSIRLTRRETMVVAVLGLTAGGIPFLLSTPAKRKIDYDSFGFEVYPGWIEASTDAKFLQKDRGHFHWLRDVVFANRVINSHTKEMMSYLLSKYQEEIRPDLGEVLAFAFDRADELLPDIDSSKYHPAVIRPLEVAHVVSTGLAAAFITWFDKNDFRSLGLPIPGTQEIHDYFWGKDGLGTKTFPKVFEMEGRIDEEGRLKYGGQDRSPHFFQHLFLTFEYLYSSYYGLSEHQSIPWVIKGLTQLLGGASTESWARRFSETTGLFYELSGLLSPENWPVPFIRGGEEIAEGIFDSMVRADLRSNALGTDTATAIFHCALVGKSFKPLLACLGSDTFRTLKRLN